MTLVPGRVRGTAPSSAAKKQRAARRVTCGASPQQQQQQQPAPSAADAERRPNACRRGLRPQASQASRPVPGKLVIPAMIHGECYMNDHRRKLVIRNTFYHYEDQEEDVPERVRPPLRCQSWPALLRLAPTPRLDEATVRKEGQPPTSDLAEVAGSDSALQDKHEPGPPASGETRTSVSLRNVPYLLSRDMLVALLNSHGFEGQYDIVYLPRDFKTSQTLGYAFINMLSSDIALRCFSVFEGFQAWPTKSLKICSVRWSEQQGLAANISAYRNSAVMHRDVPEAFKPAHFSQGRQVPFPAPTKRIRTPKK